MFIKVFFTMVFVLFFLSCTKEKTECEKNLCYNHGECKDNGRCLCDIGYNPPYCEKCADGYFLDSKNLCSEVTLEYMTKFEGAEFKMGCSLSDTDCNYDTEREHNVKLSTFSIDNYEVKVMDYKKCVDEKICNTPNTNQENSYCNYNNPDRNEHPVNCLKWSDADKYCRWLNKRLPTEAEWEFVASGIEGRKYPWGNEKPTCLHAIIYNGKAGCGIDRTARTGLKQKGKTKDGVYDMAGNVWEWVSDWYDKDYYLNSPFENPQGATSSNYKVTRGGGFLFDKKEYYRTKYRGYAHPKKSSPNIGFRCAK